MADLPYDLASIDNSILKPIVSAVLGQPTVDIANWQIERVHGGAGDIGTSISGIYRFQGTAGDQDWSLILKVVGTTSDQDNPAEPRYWKREVLAYQSGELADLPGGLAAPRFYGVHPFSERVVGLWLEDVTDDAGRVWPLQQYGIVARHVGQFNGAYLTANEVPAWPWLSQDWLREHVATSANNIARLERTIHEPETRRWFIDDDGERILQLWAERDNFFAALNTLPQTLLHRDAFRRNLFAKKDDRTVAVDWTYVGAGAVGEELVSLVHGSLYFGEVDINDARELDRIVFDAYLEGLADAGWHGDEQVVRLGYVTGSALCFGLGYFGFNPPAHIVPWLEQAFGRTIEEQRVLSSQIRHFVLELADEARDWMARIL